MAAIFPLGSGNMDGSAPIFASVPEPNCLGIFLIYAAVPLRLLRA